MHISHSLVRVTKVYHSGGSEISLIIVGSVENECQTVSQDPSWQELCQLEVNFE